MKDNQLEVGDELIKFQYGSYGHEFMKVARVTSAQAICLGGFDSKYEIRFDRAVAPHGSVRKRGGDSFGPSYYLVTDKIRAKVGNRVKREALKDSFAKLKIEALTNEQVNELQAAIDKLLA